MIRRLRVKFVCITMGLMAVMLLVIFGLVYHFTQSNLEEQSLSALKSAATTQNLFGRPISGGQDLGIPCFTLETGFMGEIIASGGDYYDLSDSQLMGEIYQAAMDSGARSGVLAQYNLRYYRVDSMAGTRFAFMDLSMETTTLNALMRNCAIIGVLSVAGLLCISILLAHWAVKPVEKAWQQQQQFVADASHELKTPLTVILTNAELLKSPEHTPEEKGRFADSILTMTQQMRGLVEGLLDLARADSGQMQGTMEPLDFSQLVEDALLPFEPLYFENGLTLESRLEPGITVKGSAQHLRQVVEILLDNGQKYSTPGGTVTVQLTRERRHALLTVETPGETLTPEQCRDIFRRFYRVDTARAMNHSYGLGLSIASQIMERHGGRIWAAGKDGINRFSVSLPEI